TWKDPAAAQKVGMSVKDYVIGGMDRGFKLKLFRALRMMDDAGFMPGITSAFRDDYRQSIAAGHKAASDSSFHGGGRRRAALPRAGPPLLRRAGATPPPPFAPAAGAWRWGGARETKPGVGRPPPRRCTPP